MSKENTYPHRLRLWLAGRDKPRKRLWLIAGALIFIWWMLTFLACYPGTTTPDSLESIRQLVGIEVWQNHTTLAYTLLVAIPFMPGYLLGGEGVSGMELGVAFNSLFQMVYLSVLFGYVCWWLRVKGAPRWAGIVVLGFFALNPIIARYAVTMWKDIPFSAGFLLLTTMLYDVVESRGASLHKIRNLVGLGLLCIFLILLRKNGLIVVVPTFLVLAFFYRLERPLLFRIIGTLILSMALSLGISGPLYSAMGVQPAHFAETVSIPLQQIARVINTDGNLTQDQQAFLEQIMPLEAWAENYNPRTPDYIKFNEAFNNQFLDEHRGEFLSMWLKIGLQNFGVYATAWRFTTEGYYNPLAINWIIERSTGIDAPLYSPLDVTSPRPGAEAKFPEWLSVPGTNLLVEWTGIQEFNVFVFSTPSFMLDFFYVYPLFNIAVMVYLSLASAVVVFLRCGRLKKKKISINLNSTENISAYKPQTDLWQNKRRYLIIYLPLLMLWLSMLVSAPAFSEFRYMFSFHLCLPLVFLVPFLPFLKKK